MTASTAYDLGATHAEDTYYCGGSLQVENWEIKCANTSGHGMQTLTEALMNSCNVAMMQIAQSVGMDRFYNFYKAFGLTERPASTCRVRARASSTSWMLPVTGTKSHWRPHRSVSVSR